MAQQYSIVWLNNILFNNETAEDILFALFFYYK